MACAIKLDGNRTSDHSDVHLSRSSSQPVIFSVGVVFYLAIQSNEASFVRRRNGKESTAYEMAVSGSEGERGGLLVFTWTVAHVQRSLCAFSGYRRSNGLLDRLASPHALRPSASSQAGRVQMFHSKQCLCSFQICTVSRALVTMFPRFASAECVARSQIDVKYKRCSWNVFSKAIYVSMKLESRTCVQSCACARDLICVV